MLNDTPTSNAELARALGISPPMVHKLKGRGMPVHSLRAALAWRQANLTPAQRKDMRERSPTHSPAVNVTPVKAVRVANDENFDQARTRKEIAEADIAEQKSAEMRGELVRRAAWEHAAEKRAAAVRETALQWPAQLAPLVAAEPDIGRCHDILLEAVMGLLTKISAKAD